MHTIHMLPIRKYMGMKMNKNNFKTVRVKIIGEIYLYIKMQWF